MDLVNKQAMPTCLFRSCLDSSIIRYYSLLFTLAEKVFTVIFGLTKVYPAHYFTTEKNIACRDNKKINFLILKIYTLVLHDTVGVVKTRVPVS